MYFSDSLDYQLDQELDQMRWEYECAMYEREQLKNEACDKEQAKRAKQFERMIEKAIDKTKEKK